MSRQLEADRFWELSSASHRAQTAALVLHLTRLACSPQGPQAALVVKFAEDQFKRASDTMSRLLSAAGLDPEKSYGLDESTKTATEIPSSRGG